MVADRLWELATDGRFREAAGFPSPPRAGVVTAVEASGQVRVAMDDPDGGDVLAWPLDGFTYAVGAVVYVAFAANSPDGGVVIGSKAPSPLGPTFAAATSKATPVDADNMPLADSAAGNVLKALSWSNLKATLKTYFDTLYATVGGWIKADGTVPLTADWDIGDTRKLIADVIRARDAAGLALQDDGGNVGLFIGDGGWAGTPILSAVTTAGLRIVDFTNVLGVFVANGGNVGFGTNAPGVKAVLKASAADGLLAFDNSSAARKAYIGIAVATNQMIPGTAAGDFIIRTETQAILISADGGTTKHVGVATNGDTWFVGNVSAQSFTDRTKGFDGDALAELAGVKTKDGQLDHATLPTFARSEQVRKTVEMVDGKEVVTEIVEQGRDLGAMISMLTVAVQQLAAEVDALKGAKK